MADAVKSSGNAGTATKSILLVVFLALLIYLSFMFYKKHIANSEKKQISFNKEVDKPENTEEKLNDVTLDDLNTADPAVMSGQFHF